MEGEHMETLSRRYHVEPPAPSPAFRVELAAIFAGVDHRPQDPDNLFRIAIALEKRAAGFFARAPRAPRRVRPSSACACELAAEEREHAAMLEHRIRALARSASRACSAATRWPTPRVPRDARALPRDQRRGAAAGRARPGAHRAGLRRPAAELRRAARARGARRRACGAQRGLKPGDRVAIKLPDGIDWVVAFLGTIWAGGVAVAVNPQIPAPEWHYILDEAGFNVILAANADDTPRPGASASCWWTKARRAVAAAAPVRAALGRRRHAGVLVPLVGHFGQAQGGGAQARLRARDRAHLARAHGHRGRRPPVRHVAAVLLLSADQQPVRRPEDRRHRHPRSAMAHGRIGGGDGGEDAARPCSSACRRCTASCCTPGLRRRSRPRACRRCVSAGEALPASLRDAWREATGIGMIDGYGASETLVLVLTALDGDDGLQPSPGVEVQPLDAEAARAGIPTRLCIRVSTLALGYLDRPAAQAESFRDGAFCPADLFLRTAAGGWRFAGREDSLVNGALMRKTLAGMRNARGDDP